MDQAIADCDIPVLKASLAIISRTKDIGHKVVHTTPTEGYFAAPSVIVKGYLENSLIAKFAKTTDREIEDFLAATGGNREIVSL